jgi:branched-chain amino acid transport system permease protein
MKTQSNALGKSLRLGLVGGAAAVLLTLIGMVEAFGARVVIDNVISLGQTLLAGTVVFSVYAAIRKLDPQNRGLILSAGAVAGAVAGATVAALVLIGAAVKLREVFVNASPRLYELLGFGQPPALGAILLVVGGALVGLATAGISLLSGLPKQIIVRVLFWLLLLGLLADLIRIITDNWGPLAGIFSWMLSGRGLSIPGALAVTAVVVLVSIAQARGWLSRLNPGDRVLAAASPATRQGLRWGVMLFLLLLVPPVLGSYISEVADQVLLFVLMGLGLNIVIGYAGLLNLGNVAFYAIGAYTVGVLTSPELGFFNLNWWVAAPLAIVVAALAGAVLSLPVLKTRGDYLAIVTLAFGEIVRLLAISDWLRPYVGGAQGIQLIAKPAIGPFVFDDQQKLYYLLLVGCLLAGFVSWRLRDSRLGRAWMAMREDEDVAQAIGINLVSTKVLAFAIGAAFAGLSGAIFAAKLGAAYAQSFGFLVSINVLALMIIGGMGSIPGVVVGALVLIGLPELLREFADFRLLVYGAVLVVMMLFRPEGLAPEATVRRELHAENNAGAEPAT